MSTRFLRIKEFSLLKTFIKNNYQKNHIMTKSNRITEFFFFNRKKNRINFIGTFEKKKLSSILGVVQNKKWDDAAQGIMRLRLLNYRKKVRGRGDTSGVRQGKPQTVQGAMGKLPGPNRGLVANRKDAPRGRMPRGHR